MSRSCERYSNAIEGVLENEGRRSIEVLQTPYGHEAGICLLVSTSAKVSLNTDVLRLSSIAPSQDIPTPTLPYTYSGACQRCLLNLSLPVLPHSDSKISEYPTTPCETSQPPRFDAFFPPFEVAASPLWQTILPLPHPAPSVRRTEPCTNSLPDAVSDMPRWRKWCD